MAKCHSAIWSGGTGDQHLAPSDGTGPPTFWKETGVAPMEAGAVPPHLGEGSPVPPLPLPRTPLCRSAAVALFPQLECAAPTAPQGTCPSPWCPGRPRAACLLWLGDRAVSQQPCALSLLGFLLSMAWQGAGRGLAGNQQPEMSQHRPGSRASPVPIPPPRAPGAQGDPPSALPALAGSHAQK